MHLTYHELQVLFVTCFFVTICIIDNLTSKIPNAANASLAIAGLALGFYTFGFNGLTTSLLGILVGLGLLIIPYAMGGFGAGDVKALMALGSFVGPKAIVQVFCYMGLFGGVLAVLYCIFEKVLAARQRARVEADPEAVGDVVSFSGSKVSMRFPYAIAIAAGYYAWLFCGDLL